MESDLHFMELAIALGEMARGISPPNPWVGCIIVKNGQIVGQGHTFESGHHHAEINALSEASEKSSGATMYVTLEPCCHHGKTPPCVDAIIKAKIAKVVVALTDPDSKVSGVGIKKLKDAGILVEVGIGQEAAFSSLESYLHQRTHYKPFVVAKSAISIDGRSAPRHGTSQWISSENSRVNAHELRFQSQAILVGSVTALMDLPTLNVRGALVKNLKNQPLRVVLDSKGRVPAKGPLFDKSIANTLIFTSKDCLPSRIDEWKKSGVEVEIIDADENGLNIEQALLFLGRKGIIQLLVEGGSTILGSFLKKKAINQLILYVCPLILGDQGTPLFTNCMIGTLKDAPRLKLISTKQIDDCIRLQYRMNE